MVARGVEAPGEKREEGAFERIARIRRGESVDSCGIDRCNADRAVRDFLEIVLRGDRRIRVGGAFDRRVLKEVIAVLEEVASC